MESNDWNCCRLCLGVQNLHPLFSEPEHHEIYSNVLFTIAGVKIEKDDSLPKEICSTCINFINKSVQFRRKCEENNSLLIAKLNGKHFLPIKLEPESIKTEIDKATIIDISHFLFDDDFRDYDDNITLNSLKHNSFQKDATTLAINNTETLHNVKNQEVKAKQKMKTSQNRKENTGKKTKNNNGEIDKKHVKCEYCHKVLTSKLSLRNHYKIHTGFDVVCEHCGKKFITMRLLLMHCRAKHGYEKTDKCSYCDYRASNAEQVKIHERLHTGEKPYACSQCDAAFHRKSSYLQHIAIHLPEKTVQCDQCPARFKSVTLMRIHRSRHRAAVYSFQCRVCEGSFARRRNVARHLLRVHNLPPEPHHIDRRKIA